MKKKNAELMVKSMALEESLDGAVSYIDKRELGHNMANQALSASLQREYMTLPAESREGLMKAMPTVSPFKRPRNSTETVQAVFGDSGEDLTKMA